MKRLTLTVVIAALVLPSTALAKGPSAATMDGPGGAISFSGDEGSGPLGYLTEQAGFFPAVFGQEPDPMVATRPKGDLGPKYTITYKVPAGYADVFTIRQDVYPYAAPSPVTYMKPGQKVFDMRTRGGWFQAAPELKATLVAAGLPATPPSAGSSDGTSFPTVELSLVLLGLLFVGATVVLVRRRARPAAA
jgi:hypothetical protein